MTVISIPSHRILDVILTGILVGVLAAILLVLHTHRSGVPTPTPARPPSSFLPAGKHHEQAHRCFTCHHWDYFRDLRRAEKTD